MSFSDFENTIASSRPVELYQFSFGSNYYRYTSGTEEVVKDGATFYPVPIQGTAVSSSSGNTQSTMTVTAHTSLAAAELFRVQPPSAVVALTIFARQLDDPDAQFVVVWLGRVLNATWKDNTVDFTCEPIETSLNRNGLRRQYQKACPHVLYSAACGALAGAYRIAVAAGGYTLSGLDLSVPSLTAYSDGYFAGGYIEYDNAANGITEVRSVRWSTGGVLELSMIPVGLASAPEVRVYPGCNHTLGANGCAKFSNTVNFGGQPWIPDESPFGGTSIF